MGPLLVVFSWEHSLCGYELPLVLSRFPLVPPHLTCRVGANLTEGINSRQLMQLFYNAQSRIRTSTTQKSDPRDASFLNFTCSERSITLRLPPHFWLCPDLTLGLLLAMWPLLPLPFHLQASWGSKIGDQGKKMSHFGTVLSCVSPNNSVLCGWQLPKA